MRSHVAAMKKLTNDRDLRREMELEIEIVHRRNTVLAGSLLYSFAGECARDSFTRQVHSALVVSGQRMTMHKVGRNRGTRQRG